MAGRNRFRRKRSRRCTRFCRRRLGQRPRKPLTYSSRPNEPKYLKATTCLQKDREALMAFYGFPAQHWQRIRTSNPIESTFGTIRYRTKCSKGCLTRDGMLQLMFKLGQWAEKNWRRLRGFDYLAKVITGIFSERSRWFRMFAAIDVSLTRPGYDPSVNCCSSGTNRP